MISLRNVKWALLLIFGTMAIIHYLAQAQQSGVSAAAPKKLQVLPELSHAQLLQVMREWSTALGVDCRFCHQDSFEAETPRKQIARLMQRDYVARLRQPDGSAIQCQNCHQGQSNFLSVRAAANSKATAGPPVLRAMRVRLKSAGVVLWRVSTKVPFLPRKHFMEGMLGFNQSLGVNCNYCHRKGDFEGETRHKQIARFMLSEFNTRWVKPDGQLISCKDCHQGQARPLSQFNAPVGESKACFNEQEGR